MNRTATLTTALLGALVVGGLAVSTLASGADATKTRTDDITTTSTTTAATPAQPAGLTDGEHVGTIQAAYVAPDELVFEPADLLTGDEAAAAAEADGTDATDFYVRHHPEQRTTAPVAGDVRVTTVDCSTSCTEGAPGDYGALTLDADGGDLYRLTVLDGTVVAIDAIYLP